MESQATLPHARWTAASKALAVGMVISPGRKKPKKQVTAAAHSMTTGGPTVTRFGEVYRGLWEGVADSEGDLVPLLHGALPSGAIAGEVGLILAEAQEDLEW